MMSVLVLAASVMSASLSDYDKAYDLAKAEKKMLLVSVGTDVGIEHSDYIYCRLPANHEHQAVIGTEGVFVADFKNKKHYGTVVTTLPRRHCSKKGVKVLLGLPEGTPTQRAMVWAVRMHPSNPQSTSGKRHEDLMAHAAKHSKWQCENGMHHDFSHPGAKEILAYSWEWNTEMHDAALDIVRSWHNAYQGVPTGHWGVVIQQWSGFGYDMKHDGQRWYATGVFR